MEHSVHTGRGKTHEKNPGVAKLGPKLGFLLFSKGCIISFPCYCTRLQFGRMSNIWWSRNLQKEILRCKLGPNDLSYFNVDERRLKRACLHFEKKPYYFNSQQPNCFPIKLKFFNISTASCLLISKKYFMAFIIYKNNSNMKKTQSFHN